MSPWRTLFLTNLFLALINIIVGIATDPHPYPNPISLTHLLSYLYGSAWSITMSMTPLTILHILFKLYSRHPDHPLNLWQKTFSFNLAVALAINAPGTFIDPDRPLSSIWTWVECLYVCVALAVIFMAPLAVVFLVQCASWVVQVGVGAAVGEMVGGAYHGCGEVCEKGWKMLGGWCRVVKRFWGELHRNVFGGGPARGVNLYFETRMVTPETGVGTMEGDAEGTG